MTIAFTHDFEAKQNVFYVNPTSGSDAWSGRYPWHTTSVTGTGGVAGQQEGPFATYKHAATHVSTGDSGSAFRSAVIILMSDGGITGLHAVTGDSGLNWTHTVDGGSLSAAPNFHGSGLGCLVIGGNTGGVIDGTIAEIKGEYSALDVHHTIGLSYLDATQHGVHFANLDFISNVGSGLNAGLKGIYCSGNSHTTISNCNFINCQNAIYNEDGKVKMNKSSTIGCGRAGDPAIYATDLDMYSCEVFGSPEYGVLMTGSDSDLNCFGCVFVDNHISIDYGKGGYFSSDTGFLSGGLVDIQRGTSNGSRNAHISTDTYHLETSVTGYMNNDNNAGETTYMIAPLFATPNKFNLLGNVLTTGGNTTGPELYSVTGLCHNIMEKRKIAHISTASSKSTAGKNGYFASFKNVTISTLADRSATFSGNMDYILDRTSDGTNENSNSWRGINCREGRDMSMAQRVTEDPTRADPGGISQGRVTQARCVLEFNCAEMQCCCQQQPQIPPTGPCGLASSSPAYDSCGEDGTGWIEDVLDNTRSGRGTSNNPGESGRASGWCQTLKPNQGGGHTGDCCCTTVTGDGSTHMSISCF